MKYNRLYRWQWNTTDYTDNNEIQQIIQIIMKDNRLYRWQWNTTNYTDNNEIQQILQIIMMYTLANTDNNDTCNKCSLNMPLANKEAHRKLRCILSI